MGSDIKANKIKNIRKYALVIIFVALCAFFTIMTDSFLTMSNIVDMLRSNSISGLLSVGVTYVILAGGIDLSTEAVACLAGIVAGVLSDKPFIALIAGILVGLIVGFINGTLLVYTGVQPFIYTLAMSRLLKGVVLIYTKGIAIYDIDESLKVFARGSLGPVPIPIFIFVLLVVVSYLLLNHTKTGRYLYSVGSNREASRLSGIPTKKISIMTYVISGVLAALAGVLLTSRVSSAEANAAEGWALNAISAVIIGGTSMRGGEGGILNTILGIFLLAVLDNGMVLMNVPTNYNQFIKGALMLVAILLDTSRKKD
ncbi:MAG TPA: ABC transporter permease [Clostridiaceae bacterium]|jgi:ribose/xylose/arabinose/galactoside ABC-type transport system permease subunit|nr:ABC transporter permease [Clostridiaceae bacterium]